SDEEEEEEENWNKFCNSNLSPPADDESFSSEDAAVADPEDEAPAVMRSKEDVTSFIISTADRALALLLVEEEVEIGIRGGKDEEIAEADEDDEASGDKLLVGKRPSLLACRKAVPNIPIPSHRRGCCCCS